MRLDEARRVVAEAIAVDYDDDPDYFDVNSWWAKSVYRGKYLYMGNDRTFAKGFSLNPDRGRYGEFGIFLTPRPGYARKYGNVVHEVAVRLENPLIISHRSELMTGAHDLTQKDVTQLRAEGYDGIISKKPGSGIDKADEVILFDRHQAFVRGKY